MTILRIWVFAAAAFLAVHLGTPPLFDADEGRNAEVAREMAETNDYVVPRLNGMPYLDKPLLYFAAEAAAMEVLGPTETAARLPSYLFTLLTAAVVFWFAKRVWGEEEGWVAAGVFLSIPLAVAFARTVIFDSALTFFMVVAIVCFHRAIEEENRRWSVVAWIAIGLGILTKGPVAIVVPLLVCVPYAIRRKRARAIWSLSGIVGASLIVAPWVWAVSREIPDFLHYVLVTETAARLATKELQRTGPPWYFVPYVIGGALPWSIVALAAVRNWKRDDRILFLLLWIAVPFLFFSLSQSKRPQYILPLMPAVALLVAAGWREAGRLHLTRIAAAGLIVLGAIMATAPFVVTRTKMKPVVASAVDDAAIPLAVVLIISGIVAVVTAARPAAPLVALSAGVILLPLLVNPLLLALGERRSTKRFVSQLRPHMTPSTEIVAVETFAGSLAFYMRRSFPVATDDASELTSNYLLRRHPLYVDRPHSRVRSLRWAERTAGECCRQRLFIVRNNDRQWRARLERRGRLVAEGAHHVAYKIEN